MDTMKRLSAMEGRSTTVDTKRLLSTLRENRELHLAEYNAAVEGYLSAARNRLAEEYEKAKQSLQEAFDRTQEELKRYDPSEAQDTIVFCESIEFELLAPRCFTEAYDQAIQMMEWETRETVELNTAEFRCYVMNRWDWMDEFRRILSTYRRP